MKKTKGFKTIEMNDDEIDAQARERRRALFKRILGIAILLLVALVLLEIVLALRRFDSYEVTESMERTSSGAAKYEMFGAYLLEFSKDGISCETKEGEPIWNQSFEMLSPQIEICGEYIVVYDAGGTEIFILTQAGLQKEIETTAPIQTACIAKQGTIAVLMKEGEQSQVKLFDAKGNELANGRFYNAKGGFPVDIALSQDGKKLAVDMLDVSNGTLATTIAFYNFGSVGQSEIDNNVGSYTYEGILIPEIDYVSNTKMIAIGTGKILVFEGSQKPEPVREMVMEQEILSCFHNDKYIGIVYDNVESEDLWHIKVTDLNGFTTMEGDISIAYDKIEFLSNNEICILNETECEIFTLYGVKKFQYTFDKELYKVVAGGTSQNYTLIFKDTIDEVKLK